MKKLLALLFGFVLLGACGDLEPVGITPTLTPDRIVAPNTDIESALRSVLLTPPDLGPGWDVLEDPNATPTVVARPAATPVSIDPGIERQDQGCGVAGLIGLPDGVKVATAAGALVSTNDEGGGWVETSAAVFPAEENARARFDAYVEAMQLCPESIDLDDPSIPAGLEARVNVTQIKAPDGAFGLSIRQGFGATDVLAANQSDVVVRRGRAIVGISVLSLDATGLDVEALTILVTERLEGIEALLPSEAAAVPLYSADVGAQRAASAALTSIDDYPDSWREAPPPVELDGDSHSVSFGARMFILSDSADCTASDLPPAPGVRARAGTGLIRVGRDHYIWHNAAVFGTEADAQAALERIVEAERRCRAEYAEAASPDTSRTWTPLFIGAESGTDRISAGVERVQFETNDLFPAHDRVSTEVSAVIRRGRMLATLTFTGGGDDPAAAEAVLTIIIERLERAERDLP